MRTDEFAVFPVESGGKRPLVRWPQESRPREQWNGNWPDDTNVGVDCGKSGLVVLDEDEPGAVERWLGYEPVTHIVRTGRGKHFYFLAPPGGPSVRNAVSVAPGVDVRGEGGYVVGAGSLHENGSRYEVEVDIEPAPLPPDVLARLTPRGPTAYKVEVDLTSAPFVLPTVIDEGTRNDTLFRYACSLVARSGIRDVEALVLLTDAYGRCSPPYVDETPEHLLARARAMQGRSEDAAFRSEVEREVRRLLVREQALVEVAERKAAETAVEWFGISGQEFDPDASEPVPCVLEYSPGRFAFPPGIMFLFGARSALKTWLAYVAVVQEVERGNRALIVDYEMSYDESMRRLHVLGASAAGLGRVVYVHPTGPVSDASRAQLTAQFGTEPPSVVVVDSMGMGMGLSGLDSNSDTDSARWAFEVPMWMTKQWPDAVIVLIDHVPKGQGGGGATDPIGSQRKGAYADGLFLVTVLSPISRSRRGRGRVVIRKDRKGLHEEGSALLDFEFGGGGPFVLSTSDPQVVSLELGDEATALVRIAAYVGQHPGTKVEDARTALGIQSAAFTAHKGALVTQCVIEHRVRAGLFPGPKWQEFMDGANTLVPDLVE